MYHGKAFAYSVAAAPFVRVAGLNGLLLFNYLMFCGVCAGAYLYLAAQSPKGIAALFGVGFFVASIVPIYVTWLTPEIFNLSLVFGAYFLCFYKEVGSPESVASRWRWLFHGRSDLVGAALLGIAIYSKPLNALLIAPLALHLWCQRKWARGVLIGITCAGVAAGAFGMNAAVTGEFNYQGGERKSFYGTFPFETPAIEFSNRGIDYATDQVASEVVVDAGVFWSRFRDNLQYFFVGRYAGLVPYYFPGVLAILLFLLRRERRRVWQTLALLGVAATVIVLLVTLPYTWAGGGGGPGNRYFISIYPALLFVVPPGAPAWSAGASWMGMLFLTPALVQPFVTAAHPWRHAKHGLFRLLPVEMTMLNDLPVMIDSGRGRIPYGDAPGFHLYFLDDNAWKDGDHLWFRGEATAQIVVRTAAPLAGLRLTIGSGVANTIDVSVQHARRTLQIEPGESVVVMMPADGAYARGAHAYLLSVTTRAGFVPRLVDQASDDRRFLGAQVAIAGISAR